MTVYEKAALAQLSDLTQYASNASAASTYTLDLANRTVKNFLLTTPYDVPQVETATAAGTVSANPGGTATVTVTSAGMTGSGTPIDVPLLLNDAANDIATKIRAALTANANVIAKFTVTGQTDKIILTARVPAANDATLNIAIAVGTATGVTAAATSADTTASGISAKTIAFSNVPASGTGVISITAEMLFTANFAITYPVAVVWKDGAIPTLTVGKKYIFAFISYDNGTTYLGAVAGAW